MNLEFSKFSIDDTETTDAETGNALTVTVGITDIVAIVTIVGVISDTPMAGGIL